MNRRISISYETGMLAICMAVAFGAVSHAAGQTPAKSPSQHTSATKKSAAPRTADGRPDLQGVWNFGTATPLERPEIFADKPVLTDEEAAAFLKGLANDGCRIIKCDGSDLGRLESAYNEFWWDWGDKLADNRTSLVVDPPNGRIPSLTPDAQARIAAAQAQRSGRVPNGPEDLSLTDRCIVGFNSGPPMAPSAYNNMVQIVQTRDHLAILNEMIHNARIVPLDGRSHLPSTVPQWVGDSRGHWDGDTLVVETTNFRRESSSRTTSVDPEHFRLIERFTRLNADTLQYEYTMNDPKTWTKAWTVRIPMAKSPDQLYEYACHEGNYSMINRLSGARAGENKASEKPSSGK